MSCVFEHPWLGGLFADAKMGEIWSAQAQLENMRAFEAAWSLALGQVGMVDDKTAETAAKAIESMSFDMDDLRIGTSQDGVVVPRLVAQMKKAAGSARAAVHQGATSQDVIDSATAIAMSQSLDLISERLQALIATFEGLDQAQGDTPMMGRTRMQAATEITVGDRIAPWALPLSAHLARIEEMRTRVAMVQIGGASGDRAALGHHAKMIAASVARQLGLANPPRAWHAMRDGIAEFAGVLSLVSGTLGKMGQDIALMAQQGIEEVSLSGGGSSSAMPHKQNPVMAELLVTLARFNAGSLGQIHQALVHEQERSGAAWALEWMVLPQMAQTTGRALGVSQSLLGQVVRIGRAS